MTDKELIKEEIVRRINDLKGYVLQKGSDQRWVTAIDQLTWIKAFIDSLPEEHNEDLEKAAVSIIKRLGGMEKDDCVSEHELKIFKAAIDWQKKKDQETIELAEDHAMLAGMNKMKEEMMENAIESIVEDWCGDSPEVTIPLNPQDFKTGDKVKILILKTE